LSYIKKYAPPDNEREVLAVETIPNVELMESVLGLMNEDQGGTFGKIMVKQSDINKWERWVSEKCSNSNQRE